MNNMIIFVFMTIMNALLFIGLAMLAWFMWTEENEKSLAVLTACLAITACAFLEYLFVGGLIS